VQVVAPQPASAAFLLQSGVPQIPQSLPQRWAGGHPLTDQLRCTDWRAKMAPTEPPPHQGPPWTLSCRQGQRHGQRWSGWAFQQGSPMRWGACRLGALPAHPLAQVQESRQQVMLSLGKLEPFRQGEGITGTRRQGHDQGHTEAVGPTQAPPPGLVGLEGRIEQQQAVPLLQSRQGLGPWLPFQQQLQLHPQPGAQSGRSYPRRITGTPSPGPVRQGLAGLLLAFQGKTESESGRIAGRPEQTGWIITNAGGMQQTQLALGQISLTAMGIEQGRPFQQQGHGIDAEVPTGQIVLQPAKTHQRIFSGHRIAFAPSGGHIQQDRPASPIRARGAIASRGEKASGGQRAQW